MCGSGCGLGDEVTGGGEETIQETGCPRAWLSASMPGRRTGCDVGVVMREGVGDRTVEGNAREEMYVAAVRYRSLSREGGEIGYGERTE